MAASSGPPGWWVAALVLVALAAIISFIVRLSVRSAVLSKGGLSPFVDKEQLEVKLAQHLDHMSAELPSKTLEERLAEFDDLHRRGVISDQELHDARAKALADGG